eukprot:GCRY01000808.1.p1 GENE.GCRY01000808.1~~GCRY01000808.1.p1  ORF type:complete len:1327 (+),score=388.93 GCRY01000808.1:166-4146(+)
MTPLLRVFLILLLVFLVNASYPILSSNPSAWETGQTGLSVTVIADNTGITFVESRSYACMFSSQQFPATFVSSTRLFCALPLLPSGKNGTYTVSLSENNLKIAQFPFTFYEPFKVTGFSEPIVMAGHQMDVYTSNMYCYAGVKYAVIFTQVTDSSSIVRRVVASCSAANHNVLKAVVSSDVEGLCRVGVSVGGASTVTASNKVTVIHSLSVLSYISNVVLLSDTIGGVNFTITPVDTVNNEVALTSYYINRYFSFHLVSLDDFDANGENMVFRNVFVTFPQNESTVHFPVTISGCSTGNVALRATLKLTTQNLTDIPLEINQCQNSGVCVNASSHADHVCDCTAEYDGWLCENNIDRTALLALKNAVVPMVDQNPFVSWTEDTLPCEDEWENVVCNAEHRVTELNLKSMGLQGTLPIEFGMMNALVKLDLGSNQLSGTLPDFPHLSALEELILSHNAFEGTLPAFLADEETYDHLLLVHFYDNLFTGAIPPALQKAPKSQFFGDRNCWDYGGTQVPSYGGHNADCPTVTCPTTGVFNTSTMQLVDDESDAECGSGEAVLGKDTTCTVFCLPGYKAMGGSQRLTCLHTGGFNGSTLVCADINYCDSEPCVEGTCMEMQTQFFCVCNLGYTGPRCSVHIEQEALLAVAGAVTADPNEALMGWNLATLPCAGDGWDGVVCEDGQVVELDLAGMDLSGTLSPYIGNLTSLHTLYLSANDFTGALPETLANLANLHTLVLAKNRFSGPLPASLGALTGLVKLDLHQNAFEGPLPDGFGQFVQLQFLSLSANAFTGSFPPEWVDLSSDFGPGRRAAVGGTGMDASSMAATRGFSPSGKRDMASCALEYVYLDHNQFSGPLPSGFYHCPIREVFLNHNLLAGTILPFWTEEYEDIHIRLDENCFDYEDPTAILYQYNEDCPTVSCPASTIGTHTVIAPALSGDDCFQENVPKDTACGTQCAEGFEFSEGLQFHTCMSTGWSGSPMLCVDVDECEQGLDRCLRIEGCVEEGEEGEGSQCRFAMCLNTAGNYSCVCPSGYEGDGFTCSDIDECAANTTLCGEFGLCVNTEGSYSCACGAGFRPAVAGVNDSSIVCLDIDECTLGVECQGQMQCVNTNGSYSCECTFASCANNGTCNAETGECVCMPSYSGPDCSTIEEDELDLAVVAAGSGAALAALCVCSAAVVYCYKRRKNTAAEKQAFGANARYVDAGLAPAPECTEMETMEETLDSEGGLTPTTAASPPPPPLSSSRPATSSSTRSTTASAGDVDMIIREEDPLNESTASSTTGLGTPPSPMAVEKIGPSTTHQPSSSPPAPGPSVLATPPTEDEASPEQD